MYEIYNREYFEDGLATGKSLYNGYQWMPERSMREAMSIIDACNVRRSDTVMDWGTAKGFLVKAFRLLGREAYGCDISRYAICTADPFIRPRLMLCTPENPFPYEGNIYSLGVAKDVLEHLDVETLDVVLSNFIKSFKHVFIAVPIGDGDRFIVPEYNYDTTHKIAQTTDWWHKKFEEHGFCIQFSRNVLPGMKDNWRHYENGNRFFGLVSWV